MELKDVILSTLAEMEDVKEPQVVQRVEVKQEEVVTKKEIEVVQTPTIASSDGEMLYLTSIKERLLVLFEGFQAPNNTNIEAKVDMTLNFLEYTLATIDSRIQTLEKGNK